MSIAITPAARAAVVASSIIGQINQVAANASKTLSSGVPAQGPNPAVSAADIVAAIGPVANAQIEVVIAAINNSNPSDLAAALAALPAPVAAPAPAAAPAP